MKKSTLLVIVTITSLFFGFKAEADEAKWPSVTVSTYIADKYVGFGTGNLLSKDPVIQSDLFVSWKNGLYIDLWNSRSLRGSWDNGSLGNEVDYIVGWKGVIASNLTLNITLAYLDEPRAFKLGAGDILYPHAFLTRDFKYLSVTAGFENYTAMPGSGFHGGNLISLGASKYQLLCKGKLGLRASAVAVYDTGTLGSGAGLILRGSAGADWIVTRRLTVNVIGVNWYLPLTPHDKRVANTMVYGGLTFKIN